MRQLLPGDESEIDPAALYAVDRAVPDDRPFVFANMVASADGAVTFEGVTEPLSCPADKRVFSLLRSLADVVLVGAGTVRAEGYGPARTPARYQAERQERGQAAFPTIAVVTGTLQLDWSSPFFTEAKVRPVVVTMASSDPGARERASNVADVVVAGEDSVDLGETLATLRKRGCRLLLTEGGPTLLGELVAGDLVDELCLTVSPLLTGGDGPRITGQFDLDAPRSLSLAHVLEEDGFLFLRYVRAR